LFVAEKARVYVDWQRFQPGQYLAWLKCSSVYVPAAYSGIKDAIGTAGVFADRAAVRRARRYSSASGALLEVAINLHPADRFSYTMSLHMNRRPTPNLKET
jgi:hypothetical protein